MATNPITGALPNETEEETKKRLGIQTNGATTIPYQQENTPLSLSVTPGSLAPKNNLNTQNAGGVAFAGIVDPNKTAASLSAAQQNAINSQNKTLPNVQQMTQTVMNNPSLGFDFGKYKQQQMDEYTKAQVNALEAAREASGGTANTGKTQFDTLANQMAFAQNRQSLSNQLDIQEQQKKLEDYYKALSAGKETASLEQQQETQKIQNQIAASQAGVPWAQLQVGQTESALNRAATKELAYIDADTKKSLMTLQDQFDTGKLIKQQDFVSAQNALDRAAKEALAKGDIQGQKDIEMMRSELQMKLQANQQEYAKSERIATQLWQTGERISQQDFSKAMQVLDQQHEEALKNGDWASAEKIEDKRIQAQIQMQLTDIKTQKELLYDKQSFENQQNALDRELKTAIQNKDIESQYKLQQLIQDNENLRLNKAQEFADSQRIANQLWQTGERVSTQQYETAKMYLQADLEKAMKAEDYKYAQALKEKQFQLDTQMQLQGFNQEEKMVKLQAEIQKAVKEDDFTKQKALLSLNFQNDMQKIASQQGFEAAMQANQNNFITNLENLKQQNVITNMQQEHQLWKAQNEIVFNQNMQMKSMDQALEKAKIALQEKGINADILQQQFQQLMASGNQQAAIDLLKKNVPADIAASLKLPTAQDAMKAADQDYLLAQYQYSKTHPGTGVFDPRTGQFKGLTTESEKDFNGWMNQNLFGDKNTASQTQQEMNALKNELAKLQNQGNQNQSGGNTTGGSKWI